MSTDTFSISIIYASGESSTGPDVRKGKRLCVSDSDVSMQKKARQDTPAGPTTPHSRVLEICTKVKEFARKQSEQLKALYSVDRNIPAATIFGHTTQSLPKRKYISGRSYASNPWMRGFAPSPPDRSNVSDLLEQFMRDKTSDELMRSCYAQPYV
jgi:hypothetical protein